MILCFQIQKNKKQREGEHLESMFNNGAVFSYDTFIRYYLAYLGTHHWQNKFMFGNVYFSLQFWVTDFDESQKIKGKTTWSQRTTN